ncbi:hypothetical protein KEM09_02430 [Carboxylicivirga mesophila]|uniref:YcxB-like protein domain-containing protein n=1 Tax=Carboxylicivirga mesophila TaxID=1166478 RepID=A0ABS5K5I7_9BACT|nr:hypothetical protein [Carboxylicivirga mesophila]MBS2210238.1 hypothetical protein [Carboxylicivirga mesophila]
MKMYIRKYLLIVASVVWVLLILLSAILFNWFDKEIDDFLSKLIFPTLIVIISGLVQWMVSKPIAEYMDSPNMEVPDFSVVKNHKLPHKKGLSLEELTKSLPKRFVVSHIDTESKKIKLYDKNIWQWGIGYIIEMRPEETIVFSFPFSSHAIGAERVREKSVAQLMACLD